MIRKYQHTGFAIAIAWPQTFCKQPGAWYDKLMSSFGISKNNYYQVGHAAVVLIDSINKRSLYFDFGRYHSPYKHGRVRSAETDTDLTLSTKPEISDDSVYLKNYEAILNELQSSSAFHGSGILEASYTPINFESAHKKALDLQNREFIAYGPFKINGSNCSRFVHRVINAGNPKNKLKLNWFIPLTPTPMSNVLAFKNRKSIEKRYHEKELEPKKPPHPQELKSTLKPVNKPKNLPNNAQWLSGEGAGSWFSFKFENNKLKVNRYSPEGELECTGYFQNKRTDIIAFEELEIAYPSNCKSITFRSKNKNITFSKTEDLE